MKLMATINKNHVSKDAVGAFVFVSVKPDLAVKVPALDAGTPQPTHIKFVDGIYVPKTLAEQKRLVLRNRIQKDVCIVPISVLAAIAPKVESKPTKKEK